MFKKEIDKLAVVNKSSDMEVSQDAGQLGNNHNELNQPTRQDKTRQDKTRQKVYLSNQTKSLKNHQMS